MTTARTVDTDSPLYLEGVSAANLMLDTGMDAAEIIPLAEMAQERAHQREDSDMYHRLAGVIHTLREYLETRD